MKKQVLRNYVILATATLAIPALLYGVYAIIWHYSFTHLVTRMAPLSICCVLLLATANLLAYCDIQDSTNKIYNYLINAVTLLYPTLSFAMHSNIETLTDQKVIYEYQAALTNILVGLLFAEAARKIILRYEKNHETE